MRDKDRTPLFVAAAHDRLWCKAGQLKFFGQHAHLADRKAFAAYLAPLRSRKWYVYSKPPFGGPEAVLAYLSRYTHRVAISNRRLIAFDQTASPSGTRTIAPTAAHDTSS